MTCTGHPLAGNYDWCKLLKCYHFQRVTTVLWPGCYTLLVELCTIASIWLNVMSVWHELWHNYGKRDCATRRSEKFQSKKEGFCPTSVWNCLYSVSSEITVNFKHHTSLVNYVKITINWIHVYLYIYIFAIADLKIFCWGNAFQQIKKPSPNFRKQSVEFVPNELSDKFTKLCWHVCFNWRSEKESKNFCTKNIGVLHITK